MPALLLAGGCDDEVEQRFDERTALPDCGRIDAGLDQNVRSSGPGAWDCFADALAGGEDAELRVDRLTDEGDPIRSWYCLDGATLEIYEDATDDSFGSGDWHFHECDRPTELGRFITCG